VRVLKRLGLACFELIPPPVRSSFSPTNDIRVQNVRYVSYRPHFKLPISGPALMRRSH
jgi:hypothetical protein